MKDYSDLSKERKINTQTDETKDNFRPKINEKSISL